MRLKGALLWSVLLHAGLLIARPPGAIVSAQKISRAVELTFVPTFAAHEAVPRVVQASSPVAAPILMAAGSAVPLPKADPPREVPRPAQLLKLSEPKLPRIQEPQPTVTPKSVELHTAGVPAASLPEKEFAQLTYRKQLREHLKKHLLYPAGSAEGIIRLRLALSPAGTIKQAFILEASDAQLAAACLEGVQSAAPFPPLPREMADAQADYEFLVQYRSN